MPAAVEMIGITKRFPRVVANDGAHLKVERGEIHALVGENGAGKSTLVRILYGLYQADAGRIELDGRPARITRPGDAIARGIGMVHQHFMLIPPLSVAENVVLGSEPRRGPILDIAEARRTVAELSRRHGLELDPASRVGDLSVGLQQRVEIVKLLYRNASILILDEPTAVLTPPEVRSFFGILRSLAAAGKTVLLITHKLAEVTEVAATVTVMRAGRTVARLPVAETSARRIAELMVGREPAAPPPSEARPPGDVVLSVEDLAVERGRGALAVDGISLSVRAGEIVGIAGVEGNGQTELVEAITGLRRPARGRITVGGVDVTRGDPRRAARAGVAHIPEDRQRRGLVLEFTVEDNMILGVHDRAPFAGRLRIDRHAVRARAADLIRLFDVRPADPSAPARVLSGGNQQKVVLAREISRRPRLLVAAQPTRGLDVGATEFVHAQLVAERERGAAVLLVSADLAEVCALSDRILVFFRGRIAGERRPDTPEGDLGALMTGAAGA